MSGIAGRPPLNEKDPKSKDKLIAWLASGRRIRSPKLIRRAMKLTGLAYDQIAGTGKLAGKVALPAVKDEQTDEEIIKNVKHRFATMERVIYGICRGQLRGAIVSGLGGVGKGESTRMILEEEHSNNNVQYREIKGKVSPIELFKALYYTREGQVLLLDDCDPMLADDDSVTLLKSALDTTKERKVGWLTNTTLVKDGVKNPFVYNGSCIFLTNLSFDQLIGNGTSKNSAHLQALMTRCAYLDLGLNTPRTLMVWIRHMVQHRRILLAMGLEVEQEQAILNWMQENQNRLRKLSIRTAIHIAGYMKIAGDQWQDMARVMEIPA